MSHLYPHIARRDRDEQVFAYWLRSLNDRNFHFSQWSQASFQEPARSVPRPLRLFSVHGGGAPVCPKPGGPTAAVWFEWLDGARCFKCWS